MPADHSNKFSPWLIAALVAAGIVTYIGFVRSHWMPAPDAGLDAYLCRDAGQTRIAYRHHANRIVIETAQGSRTGSMFYDHIEWSATSGSTADTGAKLPTDISYADRKLLRLKGGNFDGVECMAVPQS